VYIRPRREAIKIGAAGRSHGYFLVQGNIGNGGGRLADLTRLDGAIMVIATAASGYFTPARSSSPTMTDDPEQGGNRRGAIAGLAIAVVLLAVGLWLARELTATSKMQDCLMSGRTNCDVIPAQ
jgi:hypothetical protein